MSKQAIPQSVLSRALVLRANGTSWGKIAREVGFGEERLRRLLEPGFAERRAAGIREARYSRPMRGEPKVRLTPSEVARALASVPRDTRPFTARIMGDPLPGRSALDRRTYHKQTLAVRKSTVLLAPPEHGVFMEDHLNSGRVV